MMATECGGCLRKVAKVSTGKLTRYPLSNACSKVKRAGEKRSAWAKETRADAGGLPMAVAA